MYITNSKAIPINVVGSSIFGRYPKISVERTYNMFISDEWLINYAGFKAVSILSTEGKGRGIFRSIQGNFLIVVVGSSVYRVDSSFGAFLIGNLGSNVGEVIIAENLTSQICLVDGENAYIYNSSTFSFAKQTLTFDGNNIIPGFVSYHDSFFLIAPTPQSINPQNWYAFDMDISDTSKIKLVSQFSLQSKTDNALAVVPVPGEGNNVMVLGSIVGEIWTQIGGNENYRRVSSYNVDYGTVSRFTIAASDTMVVWISQNSNSSPAIMISSGSQTQRISTDGIDYLLETIKFPAQSTAIFFRMNGHLFYQFTFFNPEDNLTLVYDFNTQKFFDITDNYYNYHPARQLVYFNEKQYFVSINDGKIYQTGTDFTTYSYNVDNEDEAQVIPRIRLMKTIRMDNSKRFLARRFTFWVEQGVENDYLYPLHPDANASRPSITLSLSKNGNQTFGSPVTRYYQPNGKYKNQIHWDRMGQANELTLQLNFWTYNRVVANNGELEITS